MLWVMRAIAFWVLGCGVRSLFGVVGYESDRISGVVGCGVRSHFRCCGLWSAIAFSVYGL
ncbi:hypothetical protein [Trichormus variabilis]|uniref:hypothetical protein n=1 Tax=Anabaena variabilis TaxID=264691 RepID=UPI000F8D4275|nr:hypothetical protein [Trichormus variabilis]MBD2627977.1 hypothetical protein [Trichormus variabilis FACHB-164]